MVRLAARPRALLAAPSVVLSAVLLAALLGCGEQLYGPGRPDGDAFDYSFAGGTEGWTHGFADYPLGREQEWELVADHRPLPAPLDGSNGAIYLSGNNHSDDLFMFIKRRVDGLTPNGRYRVTFRIELATNSPSGCAGIGGAPGESVYLQGGVAPVEPVAVPGDDDHYRLNVDHGGQGADGEYAIVLGNLANGDPDCDSPEYRLKLFDDPSRALDVTADAEGAAWLFAGIDSGFEGTTSTYVTSFAVRFTPR